MSNILQTAQAGLSARSLSCIRNEIELFSDVSFTLEPGQAIWIKGANGCGKTSLLRILTGLASAESGTVLWCGMNINKVRSSYLSELSFIGHTAGVKNELTVLENLQQVDAMTNKPITMPIMEAIDKVGLRRYTDTQAGKLSAGQRRRTALAKLILHNKQLWILDEPQSALDVDGVKLLESIIEEHLSRQGMLIMTTHQTVRLPDGPVQELELVSP
jgi:heme exporter protein A